MYTEYIIKKLRILLDLTITKKQTFYYKKNTLIGYIKIDVRLFFFKTLLKVIITAVKTKLTLGAKLKLKKEKHRQKSQQLQIIDEGKPQALCGGNQCPDSTAPAAYRWPPKNWIELIIKNSLSLKLHCCVRCNV